MEPRAIKNLILDANIIIAYLAGEESVVERLSEWRKRGLTLFLPSVAESEILSFSRWTSEERHYTEEFIVDNFVSVSFDRTLAQMAGKIRAESGLKFPDAAIAASALQKAIPLVTRNTRDFKKVAQLTIVMI